ncbi:hypothetical protein [Halomicrobium katesii]|uniref:hypothetical protein n=1 Tax=Halomicrobium katesii TaxID=437163 RepID=UPI001FDFE049|nr:hypothetical protein [Halomicrobium katesii]
MSTTCPTAASYSISGSGASATETWVSHGRTASIPSRRELELDTALRVRAIRQLSLPDRVDADGVGGHAGGRELLVVGRRQRPLERGERIQRGLVHSPPIVAVGSGEFGRVPAQRDASLVAVGRLDCRGVEVVVLDGPDDPVGAGTLFGELLDDGLDRRRSTAGGPRTERREVAPSLSECLFDPIERLGVCAVQPVEVLADGRLDSRREAACGPGSIARRRVVRDAVSERRVQFESLDALVPVGDRVDELARRGRRFDRGGGWIGRVEVGLQLRSVPIPFCGRREDLTGLPGVLFVSVCVVG